ncbi:threonine synthase [soil metagenome]
MTVAKTAADSKARAVQRCINPTCAHDYPIAQILTACPACGSLLDIHYTWSASTPNSWSFAEQRAKSGFARTTTAALDASGVWRFRELIPFLDREESVCTIGEGKTILQDATLLATHLNFEPGSLHLQYEGMNPSGSFKDNGMTAAFTHARMVGAKVVACASTGNTSASMAIFAIQTGMRAVIFIGAGKIAYGKLSQALDSGAVTLQVDGDFDACLARVKHIAENVPAAGVYLMNSVNPFRLEGQKAVMFRVLEGLGWQVPDWIVVPGGNLGNCSAFGKAFAELRDLGLVDRVPRLAVINARGAATLDRVYNTLGVRWNGGAYFTDGGKAKVDAEYARMDAAGERAHTIASAIEINRPVNLAKALRALEIMDGRGSSSFAPAPGDPARGLGGVVRSVDDETIKHYKALVGRFGFGCEPASGASLAGAHGLLQEGVIKPGERVVCILTGHALKDPDVTVGYHTGLQTKASTQDLPSPAAWTVDQRGRYANPPIRVRDDLNEILAAMGA